MYRIFVTMVSMAAFALASLPARGQAQAIQAVPGGNEPLVEHLKVQDGIVFKRLPGASTNGVDCGPAKLGNAVKVLRELYPKATFAMDPRVAAVPLADVMVRADDPTTDLEALRTTCGGRFEFRYQQKGLFTLEYTKYTDLNPSTGEDRSIECFNLTGYLEREKAKSADGANKNKGQGGGTTAMSGELIGQVVGGLQEIIQKSIADFDPSIGQPHFQFYPDAQLLIVIGPERAIDVAAKVIHALPGQRTYWGEPNGGGNYFRRQRDNQELRADPTLMKDDAAQNVLTPPAPPVSDDRANRP